SGRFVTKAETPRLRRKGNSVEFVIAWKDETSNAYDIVVTQNDVREIQLAKAAIYTGASVLMKHRKIQPSDIQRVYLAGAFGNYVDPQNAKIIGMYPDVPLERVKFVGNTAGSGARMTLISIDSRKTAEDLAKRIEYVELGADPNFQDEFLKATYLPHMEPGRFPSVMAILDKRSNRL
ncbi:ferredoxin, partial [Candidatus Bathyarchaeota archaeon]